MESRDSSEDPFDFFLQVLLSQISGLSVLKATAVLTLRSVWLTSGCCFLQQQIGIAETLSHFANIWHHHMHHTLEAACWLWLGCQSNNVATGFLDPSLLHCRVLRSYLVQQCSYPCHWPWHQWRFANCDQGCQIVFTRSSQTLMVDKQPNILFAFRWWRHHVHSTVVRPFCKVDKMVGGKVWKWVLSGHLATPMMV